MQKQLLNNLITSNSMLSIEMHLIYSFVTFHKLEYNKCNILSNYLKDFKQDASLFSKIQSLNIKTIKELENALEILIPPNDKKYNGAFFTPHYIVNYIINELKPKPEDKCLDPSCGCGAFLIGLIEYYIINFNKSVSEILRENIFGNDILEYNIMRTKLIISIFALLRGEIINDSDFNLNCSDSLKAKWENKFDLVVGNPPYVKFQDLTEEYRDYLLNNWDTVKAGTFNLYFTFFELGYKLLTPKGKLGYITPNNYFTSLAGFSLRKFFSKNKCVYKIIDFSHVKVFQAQTYTSITFLNAKINKSIFYDRIENKWTPELFLSKTVCSENYYDKLKSEKWRLLKDNEKANIDLIENSGFSLGQLFDISVGIATLKDEVFFIDGSCGDDKYFYKDTAEGIFKIEKDITKSVYKISDFKTQKDLCKNNRKIIFPYFFEKGKAYPISEEIIKIKYPYCYAYLISKKSILLTRDKGKFNYSPFYSWGRTQGLTKSGPKIITPTFSRHPRFLFISEEDAFFTNGYGIYLKDNNSNNGLFEETNLITKRENIDILLKILNSEIMSYYIIKTSVSIAGGFPCYQKNFIEKFTIPSLNEKDIVEIRSNDNKSFINNYLKKKYKLIMDE